MAPPSPVTVDAISPDWLTTVLIENEAIDPGSRVESVDANILGEGEGFMGVVARLRVEYRGVPGPATMICKLPTHIAANRAAGHLLGVYVREVQAYRTLLADVDVAHPQMYAAVHDNEPASILPLLRLRKAERLPIWLLRLILRRALSDSDVPGSVLLLEDHADLEMGDHLTGCTPPRAAAVLTATAAMHASTWGDRAPAPAAWLMRGDALSQLSHAAYMRSRRKFAKRVEGIFDDRSLALLKQLRRDGRQLMHDLHNRSPLCVNHGDLRLDNMFFDSNGRLASLFDWQSPSLAPGAVDVAYFLTLSMAPDTTEAEIDELLSVYHSALGTNGVTGYSLDSLHHDYADSLMMLLLRTVPVDVVDFGEERGADLVTETLRRLNARLARVSA